MSTIIEALEQETVDAKTLPAFSPGDSVKVFIKVKEGERQRLQAFEGIVIAMRNRGIHSSFTVRKISYSEGVERVFQTYSPQIDHIEVTRYGNVRRAKLYYIRELTGKKARIKEDLTKRKTKSKKIGTAKNVTLSEEKDKQAQNTAPTKQEDVKDQETTPTKTDDVKGQETAPTQPEDKKAQETTPTKTEDKKGEE